MWVCETHGEDVCVYAGERENVIVRLCVLESVCVYGRLCVCVCVSERERDSKVVCIRECLYVWEIVCVCVRERERE